MGDGYGRLIALIPAFVKLGFFILVLKVIGFGWNWLLDRVFGVDPTFVSGNITHVGGEPIRSGGWNSCNICGMRHGANYKGDHPRTE